MGDIDLSLNELCIYIKKYRFQLNNNRLNQSKASYKDFTPSVLGSFKGKLKYKTSADFITNYIQDCDIITLIEFSVNI